MKIFYVLAVWLFVAVPNGTASSIRWSGVQDIHKFGSDLPETWSLLDVDENGVNDFKLFTEGAGFYIEHLGEFGPNLMVVEKDEIGLGGIIPLEPGTLIGSDTLPDNRGWDDTDYRATFMRDYEPGGVSGPWVGVSHGILGLMFDIDGSTHYGWADISDINGWEMTLHSWAYETQAGVPIMAGVVPEPSTWTLFLCGGVLLLAALRRRRRTHQV